MANYATKLSEAFASKALERFYQSTVSEAITNNDYEGEIKGRTSKLNVLTFGAVSMKVYNGSDLVADDISESNGQVITDQQKAWYFKIKSLAQFQSYVKNPENTLLKSASDVLKETVDSYVLSLWGDVAAGQADGTNYTTGTVTVANNTGVVTPAGGATFSAAMEGKAFKATGHTKWYRVKAGSFAAQGNGNIVIENDSDDETSSYDGGAIAGGTAYVIQANTAVQVTKDTIYTRLLALKTILDKAKIPMTDRWAVLPADLANLLLENGTVAPAIETAYDEVVKRGYINTLAGFRIYSSEQVAGDSTNGFRVMAGHKSAITFAMGMTENGVEDLTGNFGKAYKALHVYGAKVLDERRKALALGFWKL